MGDINKILAKHFSDQLTVDEESVLTQWKKENPEEFLKLESIWKNTKITDHKNLFDVTEAWTVLDEKLNKESQPKVRKLNTFSIKNWRIAASFAVLIGLSISMLWFLDPNITMQTSQSVKTIVLPDGSKVTLNKNSELSYPKKFDDSKRVLSLTGEAFFEVTPDANKPFEVSANNVLVTVLGTSFNVRSKDDNYTEVVVETGKVSVDTKTDGTQKIILTPGEKGIYKNSQLGKENNKDKNFIAWKTGIFVFENEPLNKIIIRLAEFYDASVVVEGNVSQCFASVVFENQTLNECLKELQLLFGFEIHHEENNVIKLKEITCK
ncbi:FecR family protein [Aquimarina sp. MAR_2010_214]|uniref:FecR family protein n=1 Tax=Aquimarina sp. MAR_2010_214 TaxID=1250026 RepID=UPI000C6FFF38|nr:FecR family protein [Aquimarina sp. MAR_2010_214]PKV50266.1 FecR family protein [Aquimarina sp. MAR_2010_214]